jgi:flagellar basal-body rod protein FlgG
MNGAFYVGATGLQAQQNGLDIIANNIANVNTDGYKRTEIRFSDLVMGSAVRTENRPQARAFEEILVGVQAKASARVYEQGRLRETSKPYDLAISGDGFIEVLGPAGQTWLWRGGTVRANSEGLLETEEGLVLKALIEVPLDSNRLVIGRDGKVTSFAAGEEAGNELGVISLAMPTDARSLEPVGSGFYRVADDAGLITLGTDSDNGGVIVQGSIEASNVELTTEMVNLLLLQRAYGANAQVVQAGDQLMGIANGLRR